HTRMKLSQTKVKTPKLINFPGIRKPPRAPQGLGKAGRRLWRAISAEYRIEDAGGLSHLESLFPTPDKLIPFRSNISTDADPILDRFQQRRSHPLLSELRGYETIKRQLLNSLHLDLEPLNDRVGRPGGK